MNKRIELAEKLYKEQERRQKIEDKAFKLMEKGEYKKGKQLLDTIDDKILLGILDEIDEINDKK